jgi:coenzyme F420-0:L-glutamate ligase / coenzyme F420-1:gamma-L-glutamate ligase
VAASLFPAPVRFVHLADRARRKDLLDELTAPDVLYAATEVLMVSATDHFVAGGAVHRLLMALAAEGLGTCWVPLAQDDLLGAIAVGHPADGPPAPHAPADPDERFVTW